MRRLAPLILGVLLLGSCGNGSDSANDSEDEVPLVEESVGGTSGDIDQLAPESGDQDATSADAPAEADGEVPTPAEDDTVLTTDPLKATGSTTTTTPTTGEPQVDPGLLPLVDQAKADLAGVLGVDAGSITLVSAELVEWPDTSLGCPQPDMVYMQVPTDGSLIVLSHAGTEHRYHTGGSEYVPFLCE